MDYEFSFLKDPATQEVVSISLKEGDEGTEYEVRDFYTFKPGLYVVLGVANAGKSLLLHSMANSINSILIEYGEPTEGSFFKLQDVMDSIKSQDDADKLILIDSFRTLAFSGEGSFLKGGISSSFIFQLTELSSLLLKANRTMIVVVNPIVDDVIQSMTSLISGSVTGLILARKVEKSLNNLKVHTHIFDRHKARELQLVTMSIHSEITDDEVSVEKGSSNDTCVNLNSIIGSDDLSCPSIILEENFKTIGGF
jgi:hypothetical protein